MTFDEIESAWALQQPPQTGAVDLAALKRSFTTQLNRRKRLLVLGVASIVTGLVITQILFFVNLPTLRAGSYSAFLLSLILQQGVNLVIGFQLFRLIGRQRRLAQARADSVRAVIVLAVASLEQEMSDYRRLKSVIPILMGFGVVSLWLNHLTRIGSAPMGLRVILLFALVIPISLVAWRHYRRNLLPEHARLIAALRQFNQAGE